METRRLILAAVLSVLILVVWQSMFPNPPVQSPNQEPTELLEATGGNESETQSSSTDPSGASESTEVKVTEVGSDEELGLEAEPEAPVELIQAAKEETVEIETSRARAVFSNKGAVLLSYRLKSHAASEGGELDLVRHRGTDLNPFGIVSGQGGSSLNSSLFVWEKKDLPGGGAELRFEHSSEDGVAEKVFSWDDSGFMNVRIRVEGTPNWGVLLGPGLNNETGKATYGQTVDKVAGYKRGGELEVIRADKQEDSTFLSARSLDWVTLEDNFFLAASMPISGIAEIEVRPVYQRGELREGKSRFLPVDTSSQEDDLAKELLLIVGAEGKELEMVSYFGAKQYSYLSDMPFGLEKTVRWGAYLGVLAKPLYLALEWIHSNMAVNYGVAIMLVTLLLRLIFFPLTHKSQESMGKMQELNPKVQAVRNKYRNKLKDKQGRPNVEAQKQMNEEVMGIYRTAGVNPASGCLPMLLQMPVFFAFFRLLTTAVELRGAAWMLWIQDLSQPDPYYLLPLLMGATSLGMQKMMPSSPDPMQKRIMQMMPIMFTFFAFAFPSGLVLYWLTNNILTMAQQLLINKMKARKAAATAE